MTDWKIRFRHGARTARDPRSPAVLYITDKSIKDFDYNHLDVRIYCATIYHYTI